MDISPASPAIAEALRQCGAMAVTRVGSPCVVPLVVDQRMAEVGVRCVPVEERLGGLYAQAFVRVDVVAWARRNGEASATDAWLAQQDAALGVLVAPWAGNPAPMHGMRLAVQRGADGVHIQTDKGGRWRSSRWTVRQA